MAAAMALFMVTTFWACAISAAAFPPPGNTTSLDGLWTRVPAGAGKNAMHDVRVPIQARRRDTCSVHTCQLRAWGARRATRPAPFAFGIGPSWGPPGSPYAHLAPLGPLGSAPLQSSPDPTQSLALHHELTGKMLPSRRSSLPPMLHAGAPRPAGRRDSALRARRLAQHDGARVPVRERRAPAAR